MKFNYCILYILSFCFAICISACGGDDPLENQSGGNSTPGSSVSTNIDFSTSAPVLPSEGGITEVSFTIKNGTSWTASSDQSWCRVSQTSGAGTNATINITCDENTDYDERNAAVVVTCGNAKKTITVTQKQKNAILASSNKIEAPGDSGEIEINIQANIDYTCEIDMDAKSWISILGTRGLHSSNVRLKLEDNPNSEVREGKIIFKGENSTEIVTIYQQPKVPMIILTQTEYVISSKEQEITVELESNCDYSVKITDLDWITRLETRAFSTYTLHFKILENPSYDDRCGNIEIVNNESGAISTINVTQLQKNAVILAKDEYEVAYNSTSLDFEVDHNVDFEVSTTESWIKKLDTRLLSTTGLHFDLEKNYGSERREAFIIINYEGGEQKIKVIQDTEADEHINIANATLVSQLLKLCDTNCDGKISRSEAYNTTSLELITDDLETLDGLQYFPNLIMLNCYPSHDDAWSRGITDNWEDCGYLKNGNLVWGKIKSIDLSIIPNLEILRFWGSLITSIDLSKNPKLKELDLMFSPKLKSINFGKKSSLEMLKLSGTGLESIDVSSLTKLTFLSIDRGFGIDKINVSNNKELLYLDVAGNKLSSLDISNNTKLQSLDCSMNQFSKLDLTHCLDLYSLWIAYNNFSSIDLRNNTKLENLHIQNNKFSSFDLSIFPALRQVNVGNFIDDGHINLNTISKLDFSHNPELTYVDASLLQNLESIDVSNLKELDCLLCNYDNLSILDVSENVKLKSLYAYGNPNLSVIYINKDQRLVCEKESFTKYKYKNSDIYESTDYTMNGQVNVLQKTSVGKGINLVLMGDAFNDMDVARGEYDKLMIQTMEHFFSKEPYKSYRDRFNVYSVTAVSEHNFYDSPHNTALGTDFGDDTYVYGDDGTVIEYVKKVIPQDDLDDVLTVVLMNRKCYAGTTNLYMNWDERGSLLGESKGLAITYIPLGENEEQFAGLIHHEAGGHGFAKLADEYFYEGNYPYDEYFEELKLNHSGKWSMNIDSENSKSKVIWNRFLSDMRYASECLGVFEGAGTFISGIYRPTDNSIMRFNEGMYNAPSRSAIYNRIHKLSEGESWKYDYESFVAYDQVNLNQTKNTRMAPHNFIPLHHPVIKKENWRKVKPKKTRVVRNQIPSNTGMNIRTIIVKPNYRRPRMLNHTPGANGSKLKNKD